MTIVTVAAIQMACDVDRAANIKKAEYFIRQAAQQGAQIILLPELFETPYFCKDQSEQHFHLARPASNHPTLTALSQLAAELQVVLPVSFFERADAAYYNTIMLIDANGQQLGIYRKTHIPDGPGYEEKFYFNPGNTGFKVWRTRYASIGIGICWDQWFPEAARIMVLQGAELLFYPTAIGSEPEAPEVDSCPHWQRVMQGHAAANIVPVIAANRIGTEQGESCHLTFYGSSFITDNTGHLVTTATRDQEMILTASFDIERIKAFRNYWGLFRDRRPSHYMPLLSLNGQVTPFPNGD